MTLKRITLALASVMAIAAQAQTRQPDGYQFPTDPQVLQKLDEWQDLKFGILIHWGLYSVPGIVESWNLCNEDWVVRPEGSTYEGYKQWYWGLSKEFNPTGFNPSQWVDASRKAGMKYVIFTTKHHDGFCMYDSRYTDFTIAKGPFADNPQKDIARHVFDAYRSAGFMVGAYFSKPDWHCQWFWNPYYATPNRHANYKVSLHPDWWEKYVEYTRNQLGEITQNFAPLDILWLDGGWISGEQIGLDGILKTARVSNPGMLSVDRTIQGTNENYQTPEQTIPAARLTHPWESCISLGNDWGWTPDPHYKSARRIINSLIEITAKGGSLVLGVGPTAQGIIEPEAVRIMTGIGKWLGLNGEAIYATRSAASYNEGNIWFTKSKDGKTMYAIYALPEGESLPESISWTGNLPKGKLTLLANGRKLKAIVKNGRVTVTVPAGLAQDSFAMKFECK
jgi:alpha-L-fucosidase